MRFCAPRQERRPKFSSRSRACVPPGRLRGVAVRQRAPQQQPVGCLQFSGASTPRMPRSESATGPDLHSERN
eukprot:3401551-Pyramimonas_sp.AAC.1